MFWRGTAAALYGSRKDCAILITTKLAKEMTTVTGWFIQYERGRICWFFLKLRQSLFGLNGQYAFGMEQMVVSRMETWPGDLVLPGQKIAQWNSPIRIKKQEKRFLGGMFPVRFMMTSLSTNGCPSHGNLMITWGTFTYRNYYKSDFFSGKQK